MGEFPTDRDIPNGDVPNGDDARSLLAAVQAWAQRTLPAPPSGHGGPECQWCPVCQFASLLRGENPEVAERLIEAGGALAGALKAFVDSATRRGESTGTPPVTPSTPAEGVRGKPRPGPPSRVQHIRLDDPLDDHS